MGPSKPLQTSVYTPSVQPHRRPPTPGPYNDLRVGAGCVRSVVVKGTGYSCHGTTLRGRVSLEVHFSASHKDPVLVEVHGSSWWILGCGHWDTVEVPRGSGLPPSPTPQPRVGLCE